MKVLYFSDNTSDHNRRFLEKLAQAGLETWFLDPTSDCTPQNWLPDGVRWIQARQKMGRDGDPGEFAGFLPEFQEWLKTIRPDLVHAGPAQNCGYLTALSNFHPWLLASWGSDVLLAPKPEQDGQHAVQVALESADGFFCDCKAVLARANQLAKLRDDRVVQLPWGIRKGLFTPDGARPEAQEFAHEPGTCVFISTRSWEPLYGIDVLLEAFRLAHQVDPSLRLLLLGQGAGAARVAEFIRAHGLEGKILAPGRFSRDDMPKWFRAADVYVSCSRSDGTSISLLEAMATGLPVVVTDLPSNREWVIEGENGWLAANGNAKEFANGFLRAARLSPEERKLFAERNQRIVEERADWDRNFPRLLEMYEQLVGAQVFG
jgi:glycosyltransferase involved in cell wall biosynthesis